MMAFCLLASFCLLLDALSFRLCACFFLFLCGFVTTFRIFKSVGVYFSISLMTESQSKFRRFFGSLLLNMESDLFERITLTSSLITLPILVTTAAFRSRFFVTSSAIATLLPRAINFPNFFRVGVKMKFLGFLYPIDTCR